MKTCLMILFVAVSMHSAIKAMDYVSGKPGSYGGFFEGTWIRDDPSWQPYLIDAEGFPTLYVTVQDNITRFSQKKQDGKFKILRENKRPGLSTNTFVVSRISALPSEKDVEIIFHWRCLEDGYLRVAEKYRYTSDSLALLAKSTYRISMTNAQYVIEIVDDALKGINPVTVKTTDKKSPRLVLSENDISMRTYSTSAGVFKFSRQCIIRVPQFPDLYILVYQYQGKYNDWRDAGSAFIDFARKMPDGRFELLMEANNSIEGVINIKGVISYLEDIAVVMKADCVEVFIRWKDLGQGGIRNIDTFRYTTEGIEPTRKSDYGGRHNPSWTDGNKPIQSIPATYAPQKK